MRSVPLVLALVLVGASVGQADFDRDRLRREARTRAPAELEARLVSPVRAVRLAAIAGADAAPDAAALLDELATAAGDWDRSVAAPAARAARAIARGLVGGQGGPAGADGLAPGEPAELDGDEVAAAQAAWLSIARRGDRWADVRVHALEIVVALAGWRREATGDPGPPYDVEAFGADPDPEVRRAAIELVPVPAPAEVRAFLALKLTDERPVGLAAAQALCAGLPRDAAAALVALGPDGLEQLRALVAPPPRSLDPVPPPVPGAAELDAARCLAAAGDPASRRTIEALRHRLPRALRPTLAAVAGDVAARAPRPH